MAAGAEPSYTLAFASFGPLNTDLFTADADGRSPQPLVPHADNDYNASFSHDGRWIVFTSHPNGSADGRSDRRARMPAMPTLWEALSSTMFQEA